MQKFARLLLLVPVLLVEVPSRAAADVQLNTVQYTGGASIYAGDGYTALESFPLVYSNIDVNPVGNSDEGAVKSGGDEADISVYDKAAPGILGISSVGNCSIGTPDTGASAGLEAYATFNDFLTFHSNDTRFPVGTVVHVLADLNFTGVLGYTGGSGSGDFGNVAYAFAKFTLTGTGLTYSRLYGDVELGTASGSSGPQTATIPAPEPVMTTVPVAYTAVVGSPFDIGYTLEDTSTCAAISSEGVTPSASAYYYGDFHDTLAWGGITSVTDVATGESLDNYTVTSGSGTDYSQAVTDTPEPAAWAAFAVAAAALLCRRGRTPTRLRSAR